MRYLAAALLTLSCALQAQTLVNSLPADVLVYYRADGGWDEIRKFAGSNGIWSSPLDLDSSLFAQMDEGLAQMGEAIGVEVGSLRTYVRSFKAVEGALFSVEFADGPFSVDFVVSMDTPLASEIYDLASGALVKRAFGEKIDDDTMSVPLEDDFGLHIGRRGEHLVIAGSESRLREAMDSFGKVVPGNFAQTEGYKNATGGLKANSLFYCRVDALVDLAMEARAAFEPRGGGAAEMRMRAGDEIWKTLGMHRIRSFGYAETDRITRFAVTADGPVLPFQMMAANGDPDLLGMLPSDTAVGMTWGGKVAPAWKLFFDAVVTNPEVFGSAFIAEGVRSFQKKTGINAEDLAALLDRGLAFGVVPRGDGRIEDESVVAVARTSKPEEARRMAQKILETMAPGGVAEGVDRIVEEGPMTWFFPEGRTSKDLTYTPYDDQGNPLPPQRYGSRPVVSIAMRDDLIVAGTETTVRKVVDAFLGTGANLNSIGATKGLKPGSAMYMFLQFQPLFAQENDFSAGYHALLPGAGVSASLQTTDRSLTVTTSRRISEVISTFALAAVEQESLKAQAKGCRANLEKIKEAYDLYHGEHGKHPESLAQLGFAGDKALVCPLDVGAEGQRRPYRLFPGDRVESDGPTPLRACCDHTRHGRLAVDRAGSVRSWSEAAYQSSLKVSLPPPK